VVSDVFDGFDQLRHAGEYVPAQALGRDITEEALNHVQPRCRGGREVHFESRMHGQPFLHGRMLVRGIVINKTKSVIFTEAGLRESERLFKQHFVIADRTGH